jgi:farnesyl-diphosphate farnesyltransferase
MPEPIRPHLAANEHDSEAADALEREDCAFNVRMLPLVSRTFALSILYLPPSLREAVGVAYLLCRIVDSVEDAHGLAPDRRRALFDAFDALLEHDKADPKGFETSWQDPALVVTDAERLLCRGAGATFRRFRALPACQRDAIRPHVREMSRGMRSYAARMDMEGKLRIRDIEDLERYCYFVAGTVGELLTALFEQEVPSIDEPSRKALWARAVPFGLGLQLVNIVKDVAEDAQRGACFLPLEVLSRHGTDVERILDPDERPKALAALHEVCALARRHLEAAVEYTLRWPAVEGAEVRAFCAVPLALALCTLREVERGDDALVPGREPKVDRAMVAEILSGTRRSKDADASLARLFARASEASCARAMAAPRSAGPLVRARRPPTPPVRRSPPEMACARAIRSAATAGPLLRAHRPPTPPIRRSPDPSREKGQQSP